MLGEGQEGLPGLASGNAFGTRQQLAPALAPGFVGLQLRFTDNDLKSILPFAPIPK